MVKSIFLKAQASSLMASSVDFTTTVVLVELLKLPALLAAASGTITGGILNFIIGRHWVFNAKNGMLTKQVFRYVLVWMGNFALNFLGFAFMVKVLDLNYFFSKVFVSVIVGIFYNYYLQEKYVFK
ncbi:MAG: GtrA family protein [Sphingobacteriia bacterium]|nr:MAG: GtrA family protein [Sphingobacteriia bacterium]TAG32076.1 MAG: GtrA family protein [Sphingobacteriia bacterium]TAH09393.1 MAG: GtrA family protein [Sphingobacteriia bacterium]